jgi:hypothetical protein
VTLSASITRHSQEKRKRASSGFNSGRDLSKFALDPVPIGNVAGVHVLESLKEGPCRDEIGSARKFKFGNDLPLSGNSPLALVETE